MGRYDALTTCLLSQPEPVVTLTFDELDTIVGGLPNSAKTYGAWWANSQRSHAHAKAWLDAGRRASPDFRAQRTAFTLDSSIRPPGATSAHQATTESGSWGTSRSPFAWREILRIIS